MAYPRNRKHLTERTDVLHRQPRLMDQAELAGFFSFLAVRAKTIRIGFLRIKCRCASNARCASNEVAISLQAMTPHTTTQTSPPPTAQTTPGHRRRTQLLVLIAILTQVAGNIFLSHGMRRAGAIVSASPMDYLRALNPWTLAGICALAIWMITDLALLSRADEQRVIHPR